MSTGDSGYTVGRGKPPLHTRFQKGQSGNPSGKPGPARLARKRFHQSLQAALEAETWELKDARPRGNLDAMVRRLMLDAAGGNRGAMKLILSELEKESAREEPVHQSAQSAAEGQADEGAMEEQAEAGMAEEAAAESGKQGTDEPPRMMDHALWVKTYGRG